MTKNLWKSIGQGIRYYEHETRKYGVKKDRYFAMRHTVNGKRIEEGLGWASQGWTAKKAHNLIGILNENKRRGERPHTLKEKREMEAIQKHKEQEEKAKKQIENITFENIFEGIYTDTTKDNKHPRTWEREEGLFKSYLKPIIGNKQLPIIVPLDLERVKRTMKKKDLSPRSIQYALAVARQVFNFAIRHSLLDGVNPVSKVKLPSPDNRRMRFLTPEEADALLTKLKKSSPKVHNLALLSLHTGMRAGEIFNLEWRDVDLDRGIIILRNTKNGRTRAAFMTGSVKKILKSMKKRKPSALVFTDRNGKLIVRVSPTFQRTVNALELNKGIQDRRYKVCFHTLRHTFASWHIENGTDPYIVKELLGHSDFKMTERYSHLGENTIIKAVKRMNDFFDKPCLKKTVKQKKQ